MHKTGHKRERDKAITEAKQKELTTQLEELSRELVATRVGNREIGDGNNNRHREPSSGEENRDGGNFFSKYSKLDFSHYDGTFDPLGWLNCCEHFFCHQ